MKVRSLLSFFLAAPLAFCGCESKSKARAQARAAYVAGRASAYQRMQERELTDVRIIGEVVNPKIAWEEGMTLATVLLVAGYQKDHTPLGIFIERMGRRIQVDMAAFLKGEDLPLEPGDIIVIND